MGVAIINGLEGRLPAADVFTVSTAIAVNHSLCLPGKMTRPLLLVIFVFSPWL